MIFISLALTVNGIGRAVFERSVAANAGRVVAAAVLDDDEGELALVPAADVHREARNPQTATETFFEEHLSEPSLRVFFNERPNETCVVS